jgi:PAS domain S-box-containing protein
MGLLTDITQRKMAEADSHRINRGYAMLSECNKAVARAEDELHLLNDVCRIAVERGSYRMAWVGYASHDPNRKVLPVARQGYDAGYVETVDVRWADGELGRSPVGTAIRTRHPVVCKDITSDPDFAPWREEALQRGYRSAAALPLLHEGEVQGMLAIYADEPGRFREDEVSLLMELATNVAFGIATLRARAEHRRSAEEVRLNYALQAALNSLLRMSLEESSEDEFLCRALDVVLEVPWYDGRASGAFLAGDNKEQTLRVRAQSGDSALATEGCACVAYGDQLCGKVALTHEPEYGGAGSCAGDEAVRLCTPVVHGGKTLGVFCIHLRQHRRFTRKTRAFLSAVANIVAGVLARRQAERSLSVVQFAVDRGAMPFVMFNAGGSVEYVNDAACARFGYSRKRLLQLRACDLATDVDMVHWRGFWGRLERKRTAVIETEGRTRNGHVFPAEIAFNYLEVDDERYAQAFIRDITDRKRADEAVQRSLEVLETQVAERTEQLRLARDAAEAANRAKSDFLASMSHELRTPLNAIIGFSEILQQGYFGPLTEKQGEYVHDILDSGRHLLALINDVLDLAKIESGHVELNTTQVVLADLVAASLIMVKEKCHKHGIALTFEASQAVEGVPISGDERRLKQVMFNLLSNAAKFTPAHGAIGVHVDEGEPGFLRVSVSDTGAGLDAADLTRIFEEYFQSDAGRKAGVQGTGLGLNVTRRILGLHGGRVWAESPGRNGGSRFCFELPAGAGYAGEAAHDEGGCAPALSHVRNLS